MDITALCLLIGRGTCEGFSRSFRTDAQHPLRIHWLPRSPNSEGLRERLRLRLSLPPRPQIQRVWARKRSTCHPWQLLRCENCLKSGWLLMLLASSPSTNGSIPSPYPVTVVVAKLLLDPAEAQESETKFIPKHCIRIC